MSQISSTTPLYYITNAVNVKSATGLLAYKPSGEYRFTKVGGGGFTTDRGQHIDRISANAVRAIPVDSSDLKIGEKVLGFGAMTGSAFIGEVYSSERGSEVGLSNCVFATGEKANSMVKYMRADKIYRLSNIPTANPLDALGQKEKEAIATLALDSAKRHGYCDETKKVLADLGLPTEVRRTRKVNVVIEVEEKEGFSFAPVNLVYQDKNLNPVVTIKSAVLADD